MNADETDNLSTAKIDASCRVPLLALFGGAALWLVAGLVMSLLAIMTFHKPDMFADCPFLTYGRAQTAANDLLLYGFCIPAGLGVMLWIFARLSRVELSLPLVPVAAANLWHLGVLIGVVAILIGNSTGFGWLEFPRGSSVLLFAAFLLVAVSAAATFGARSERELYPSHWFLLAALLWFPWIYATANLFLLAHHPVRGVAQAVIDWWFSNNLVFVWLALVGVGTAFYFLPKFAGRPLHSRLLALFAFWTLILFGTWCGIPQGAPVPAWLPSASAVGSVLVAVPILAVAIVAFRTVWGCVASRWSNSPFCFIGSSMDLFVLSSLMFIAMACPQISRVTEFTWFGPAQVQLQILGFFGMVMFGAIYELLPRVMGFALPFPKLARVQFWLNLLGVLLWAGALAVGGVEQGMKLQDGLPFADSTSAVLPFLRAGTTGLLLVLAGALLFALNIFVMTYKWKMALLKALVAAIKAPLEPGPDAVSLRHPEGEVKS
ncbi:MAG TPA: cbb3-type cytochrome c oxidase subunit I [Verrucomicrobiae bacterium]|nr:cbb3-type cytochrome c oxidase subunit I [Verrucomicrobiae bacterium]